MFEKWKEKRAAKRAAKLKIKDNEYLTRLQNSAKGYCGCSHSGEGPFLNISEISYLIWAELERKSNE